MRCQSVQSVLYSPCHPFNKPQKLTSGGASDDVTERARILIQRACAAYTTTQVLAAQQADAPD